MIKYVGKRLLVSIVTLFTITFVLFLLMELLPGSPFNDEKMDDNTRALLEEKYGLTQPFLVRYGIYAGSLVQGDFGASYSISRDMPVSAMLGNRLPVTTRIGLQALVVGVLLGLVWGIVAALKRNTWIDTTATFFSVLGFSVPSYVFALFLVFFIAFKLEWFPIRYSNAEPFYSSVLPTLSLAMYIIAVMARYARSEMIECLNSDYITLAKAKGVSQTRVIIHHALRNTMVPIITVVSPLIVGLITGSVVVEQIFGVPGLGQLLLTGIQYKDYNVVLAIALVFSALYIVIILVVDILYGLIDPRIRVAGSNS